MKSKGAYPTVAVSNAANIGLRLLKEGRGGKGLTRGAIVRAITLARREFVSVDRLKMMRAWFARHKVDRRPGWNRKGQETPGYVAWMLWGGNAGRAWVAKMLKKLDRPTK